MCGVPRKASWLVRLKICWGLNSLWILGKCQWQYHLSKSVLNTIKLSSLCFMCWQICVLGLGLILGLEVDGLIVEQDRLRFQKMTNSDAWPGQWEQGSWVTESKLVSERRSGRWCLVSRSESWPRWYESLDPGRSGSQPPCSAGDEARLSQVRRY